MVSAWLQPVAQRFVVAAAFGVIACEQPQRVDSAPASDIGAHVVVNPSRPGAVFDPSSARPGQTVGDLVLESISATPTLIDSTLVGSARFRGEVRLHGVRMAHHDADARGPCFEADSLSASRLPRWRGDERRMWFCFSNDSTAAAKLMGIEVGAPLSVVIDEFTIHRNFSDAVNTARLVRMTR